jgi:transcriptional regulator with PAS, ATPase and Fis domain
MISKIAPTSSNVLITGESGVGKEIVARAIHLQSPRKDKVFLPVNCSAIPETLLESQLFGYMKGAFTGAASSQEGLFQRAQGGTIFLDEIGEMPLSLQPKILRVIEDKEILPIGSTHPAKLNVRIIAATNRELQSEVRKENFARTCSTDSMSSTYACRRCAIGARIFLCWLSIWCGATTPR